jgi:hypothetical protein
MYQAKLCSALVPACGPRPDLADQPTDIKPGTEVETPGTPDTPSSNRQRPRSTTRKGKPPPSGSVTGEGSPVSAGVPASIVNDRTKTDTDRSLAEARLAARVDRSSGCRFQLVLAEQTRRPSMPLCCSQFASSDRSELDPRRSQRSNNGVADRCELGRLYHSRVLVAR